MQINPVDVTGVVLCGGLGTRMGGADKGLIPWRGQALALHVARRLEPQVGRVMINANRNLPTYRGWGYPVIGDTVPDHPGPLAGFLSALEMTDTDWVMTCPCDVPVFGHDLVHKLAQALPDQGLAVSVVTVLPDGPQAQPTFSLMHRSLAPSLREQVQQGLLRVRDWQVTVNCTLVSITPVDLALEFANFNTLASLRQPPPGHTPQANAR